MTAAVRAYEPLRFSWGHVTFTCVPVMPWAAIDAVKRGLDRLDADALLAFVERMVVPGQRDLFRQMAVSLPRESAIRAAAIVAASVTDIYADRLVDPALAAAN